MYSSKDIRLIEKNDYVPLTENINCSGEDLFLYNACFKHALDEIQKYKQVGKRTIFECKKIKNDKLRHSMFQVFEILNNFNLKNINSAINLEDVQAFFFKKNGEGRSLVKNKFLENDKYVTDVGPRLMIKWYDLLMYCENPKFKFYDSNIKKSFTKLAYKTSAKYKDYVQ